MRVPWTYAEACLHNGLSEAIRSKLWDRSRWSLKIHLRVYVLSRRVQLESPRQCCDPHKTKNMHDSAVNTSSSDTTTSRVKQFES